MLAVLLFLQLVIFYITATYVLGVYVTKSTLLDLVPMSSVYTD